MRFVRKARERGAEGLKRKEDQREAEWRAVEREEWVREEREEGGEAWVKAYESQPRGRECVVS